ncbi:hypothetical protein FBZ89_103224 [Nitrospirillum amazonense]|uniref:Uncharacterized protein n=1 Tax=Nitrospirillum amazonense TaxID=28077 RepID=A0A560FLZ7_9PROT|nr:hypothetical protein [Nitrospirillum amazonense]TWB22601.1 hypothetical protein FBZ89_103224 [Nitrospirillum amazonense]
MAFKRKGVRVGARVMFDGRNGTSLATGVDAHGKLQFAPIDQSPEAKWERMEARFAWFREDTDIRREYRGGGAQ